MQNQATVRAYIGTYTRQEPHVHGKAAGIYVYNFDPATGAFTPISTVGGIINPAYIAIDPSRRFLYAVNEVAEIDGAPGGTVSAFAIDPATGDLTLLNQQPTRGGSPCYVSVDASGQWVFVANYGGGNVTVLPINADGRLGAATAVVQHYGSGANPDRQAEPHAHMVAPDPTNRFVFAADLGIDKLLIYRLDQAAGTLTPNDPPSAALHPGAGPRHFAFHPGNRYLYVVNELDSTLTAFQVDQGKLHEIHTISMLPRAWNGENWPADVHVAPSGKFVYASNRGHDSIAIFAIDAANGRLTLAGHEATRGKAPRGFAIDPSGAWLIVANQDTDSLVTFRIDQATGGLTFVDQIEALTPVCVKFVQV